MNEIRRKQKGRKIGESEGRRGEKMGSEGRGDNGKIKRGRDKGK